MNKVTQNPVLMVIILVLIILIFTGQLSGCSMQSDSSSTESNSMIVTSPTYAEATEEMFGENYVSSSLTSDDLENKVVRVGDISLNSKDFDSHIKEIYLAVTSLGGYVESSSVNHMNSSNQVSYRQYYATLRVPSASYYDVKNTIEGLGNLISSSDSEEDRTTEYSDINSKLNLKLQEEVRILDLIEMAETVEDLIALEERLGDVRADIEIYSNQLYSIDDLVTYSTINISIHEVPSATLNLSLSDDFGSRIKNAFVTSFNNTIYFFEYTLVAFASYFVPIVVLVIVFVICIKRFKAKRLRSRD